MPTKIALIGLGNMGGAMAHNLLRAGYTLHVYARRPPAMQPFVAAGAHASISPAEAASDADFILTNVTSTADVESVLLGDGGAIETAKPGAIVCDFSTIDATATRRIATTLAAKKIEFLDCPVSGGTKAAEAGALSIMVGGKADVLERARPILEKLGKTISHMGDVGSGQITKACNQIVQVVNIQGIAEAMLFARANGVDTTKVVDALMAGMAGSKMLDLMGRKMAARDFAAGIEARLHAKDFGLVADAAEQQHLPMPAVALVHQQLTQLMVHGWGNMDTCNLLRVLEETK
jgi:3-hydroxyisobutyrate dehydrogenase-like beta-hydroxyacid dehydrogenase